MKAGEVMENSMKGQRIWEIDMLRGLALLLMIVFHIVFDLRDIYGYPVIYDRGFYYYVGKSSAILFMLIAGTSCSLSRSNIKRGARIILVAMGITLATYLFMPDLIIKFGILHFFGISMILYPLFKPMDKYMLVLVGTLVILVGNYFSGITVHNNFLFPIGLTSSTFTSSDYYPLFPWFGVFLYGAALGKFLYQEKKSLFSFNIRDNILIYMGRHSLLIYVIHQPVIILVLNLIFKKSLI
jgi:uncharacterized membrane protein